MEHGEADGAREGVVREGHGGGVALDNRYVSVREPRLQRSGQPCVDLDRGEMWHALPEPIGGVAWSGADLQDCVAEVPVADRGRHHVLMDDPSPTGGAAVPAMDQIHRALIDVGQSIPAA